MLTFVNNIWDGNLLDIIKQVILFVCTVQLFHVIKHKRLYTIVIIVKNFQQDPNLKLAKIRFWIDHVY